MGIGNESIQRRVMVPSGSPAWVVCQTGILDGFDATNFTVLVREAGSNSVDLKAINHGRNASLHQMQPGTTPRAFRAENRMENGAHHKDVPQVQARIASTTAPRKLDQLHDAATEAKGLLNGGRNLHRAI
jgi:hypothetical protein